MSNFSGSDYFLETPNPSQSNMKLPGNDLRAPFQYAGLLSMIARKIWNEDRYFPFVPNTDYLGHLFWELIMAVAVARNTAKTLVFLKPGRFTGHRIVNEDVFDCDFDCKFERKRRHDTIMNALSRYEKYYTLLRKDFLRIAGWAWPIKRTEPVMRFHRCGIEPSNFLMAKVKGTKHYFDLTLLPNSEPSLRLTAAQRERARKLLLREEFDDSQWFATAHVREAGFRGFENSHDARNFSQHALLPIVRQILSQGGFVVRMGTKEQSPIPQTRGLFDYAHSGIRSSLLDMYLMEKSRFYVGASSGPHVMALAFGKPAFVINVFDFLVAGFRKSDMFIPKMFFDPSSLSFLSIQEYCSMIVNIWDLKGCWHVENKWQDIESCCQDFRQYLEDGFTLNQADQELYWEWSAIRERTLKRIIAKSSGTDFDETFKDYAMATLNAPAMIAPSYLRKYLFKKPDGFASRRDGTEGVPY